MVSHFVPGKRVKSFSLADREYFDKNWEIFLAKNNQTRINKKREGAFFPYVHLIENKHVQSVLERLQIYKKGVVPEEPDVCFVEAIKDQIPDGILLKIKHDVRSEHVSIPTITKICKNNNIFVKIRMDRYLNEIVRCGDEETALFKADICKVGDHYFRFIENTGVTWYFINHYDELKAQDDGQCVLQGNQAHERQVHQ